MTEVAEQAPAQAVERPTLPLAGSLSPSRAADFKTCPLLYRFRSVDRIPQRPTTAAARGTLVHTVLERLFDLPAAERTYEAAAALVEPEWAALAEAEPEIAALFPAGGAELAEWLDSARRMVAGYFALEDPTRLEPAAREQLVEAVLDLGDAPGLALRGYVDRLDVAPTGELRVVDYKTGAIPRVAYEAKALFQLKFYALVLWRTRGTVPHTLKLMYLNDRDTLAYRPDAAELERFERTLVAVWRAIERAVTTQDFRANPSRLCGWCDYQSLCPPHGGTLPPYPVPAPAAQPDPAPAAQPDPAPAAQPDPALPAAQPDPALPAAQPDPALPAARPDAALPAARPDGA